MDSCKSFASLANGFKGNDSWIVVGCIDRQSDLESCLLTFGVRNYDPTTGRFLSIDPIWTAYLGMSPYAYCGNSPNVLVDPSGFGGHRVVHHTENGDWTTMEPDEEPMPSGAGYGYEGDGLRSFGGGGGGGPIALPPRSKLKQWIKTAKRIAGDIILGVGHGIAEEGGQMTHYDGGVARICFGWYVAPLRDSGMW